MTNGYASFFSKLFLCSTNGALLGLLIPEAPRAKPVITAPMSPIERNTPPSAKTVHFDERIHSIVRSGWQINLTMYVPRWNGPFGEIVLRYTIQYAQ